MNKHSYGDGYADGKFDERNRLMELLEDLGVVRYDALGSLVYVNCNSMEVEYLSAKAVKGEK